MTYPPPPPSAPVPTGKLRGARLRLIGWISLGLAVVLFIVGGVLGASGESDKVGKFQRVTVAAGSGTFQADRTGEWIGYYEADNVTSDIERIPQIKLQITDPAGQNVPFTGYGDRNDGNVDKKTYDTDGHKGAAAIQFTVEKTGEYTVRMQAVDTLPSGADIAFGDDIGGVTAGIALVLVAVLLLILAVVLLIVGFVKRGRDKRERQAAAYAPAYGGSAPGYAPPGYEPPGYEPPGQNPGWGPQGQGPSGGPPPSYGPPQ